VSAVCGAGEGGDVEGLHSVQPGCKAKKFEIEKNLASVNK
jgi:hypothetical protein